VLTLPARWNKLSMISAISARGEVIFDHDALRHHRRAHGRNSQGSLTRVAIALQKDSPMKCIRESAALKQR
jgi:hypothetical protein